MPGRALLPDVATPALPSPGDWWYYFPSHIDALKLTGFAPLNQVTFAVEPAIEEIVAMEFRQFDDAREFCSRCRSFLLTAEAENSLLIGIATRLAEQRGIDWGEPACVPLLCGVEEAGRMLAAAVMTSPLRLIVTRMPALAAEVLAHELHARQIGLPGVTGPAEGASTFAQAWSKVIAQPATQRRVLRVYELDRVIAPPPISGKFEAATMADCDLVVRWTTEFWKEIDEHAAGLPQTMRRRIMQRQVFLWLDPGPVCMAGFTGPTPNGIRIGVVYTPPERRRHGYATALTAALSQHLLDTGRRYCYLFTDVANTTSNGIYQKIGYKPVCDYQQFDFPRQAWPKVAEA